MEPKIIVIDLFCGAGGTTCGIEGAVGAQVIACVNHDENAIRSHEANHPDCKHFTEDITTAYGSVFKGVHIKGASLVYIERLVNLYRLFYPDIIVIIWASLECTNFSKAKGGLPRDADSRTLALHLDRYIIPIAPDYIWIENVVEFMAWGPLDENGKPVSKKNGEQFMKWCKHIDGLGYRNEWKELDSADFGAYQKRNRLFGQFATSDKPVVWPIATHSKKAKKSVNSLFNNELQPHKPVKDVLNLHDEGKSIFNRKKPLVDKSLERIYAGLIKFVAHNTVKKFEQQHEEVLAYAVKYNSATSGGSMQHAVSSIDMPSATVTTQNRLGIAFIQKYYSGSPESKVISTEQPSGTITTFDHHSLVKVDFCTNYYGNGAALSIEEPSGTITTKDRVSKIAAYVVRDFTNGGNTCSVNEPAGSILSNPKLNLVQCFVMPTNFNNLPVSIDEPAQTITANRKHHYVVNLQWGGNEKSVEEPSLTIIARQDKTPLYLTCVHQGTTKVAIRIDEGDSEVMIKIKVFMCLYSIIDIKMRMFTITELKRIQGFPDDYVLIGNQAEQKKYIGNAVHPLVPKAMVEALLSRLIDQIKEAA